MESRVLSEAVKIDGFDAEKQHEFDKIASYFAVFKSRANPESPRYITKLNEFLLKFLKMMDVAETDKAKLQIGAFVKEIRAMVMAKNNSAAPAVKNTVIAGGKVRDLSKKTPPKKTPAEWVYANPTGNGGSYKDGDVNVYEMPVDDSDPEVAAAVKKLRKKGYKVSKSVTESLSEAKKGPEEVTNFKDKKIDISVGDHFVKYNRESPVFGKITGIQEDAGYVYIDVNFYLPEYEQRYEADTDVAFSMGTYGNAMEYPVINVYGKPMIDEDKVWTRKQYRKMKNCDSWSELNPKSGRYLSLNYQRFVFDDTRWQKEVLLGTIDDQNTIRKILADHPELEKEMKTGKMHDLHR